MLVGFQRMEFSDFYLSANREQGTMGGGIRCEDRGEHTMQGIWDNGRQKTQRKNFNYQAIKVTMINQHDCDW